MSAPVTEAHLALLDRVSIALSRYDRAEAAQLIADSEALATAELKKRADHWCDMHTVCAKERDQLRAEVERLKKQIKDDNRSYGCELRDPYGTIWEQATKDHDRAGKAERALAELREWQAGIIANERLHHAERKEAIARAERAEAELAVANTSIVSSLLYNTLKERLFEAEAELAAERARVADLVADLNDACITLASAAEDCDDYAMQNTGFKLTAVREVLLQHIPNAAMKEGA